MLYKKHTKCSVLQMEWEMWKDVSQTTYFSATCITPSDTIWTNIIPLTKTAVQCIRSCLNHTQSKVLVIEDQEAENFIENKSLFCTVIDFGKKIFLINNINLILTNTTNEHNVSLHISKDFMCVKCKRNKILFGIHWI